MPACFPQPRRRPGEPLVFFTTVANFYGKLRAALVACRSRCPGSVSEPIGFGLEITLSGGSLGSCVDEERSQLRELM